MKLTIRAKSVRWPYVLESDNYKRTMKNELDLFLNIKKYSVKDYIKIPFIKNSNADSALKLLFQALKQFIITC
jgi:hypothetical protein